MKTLIALMVFNFTHEVNIETLCGKDNQEILSKIESKIEDRFNVDVKPMYEIDDAYIYGVNGKVLSVNVNEIKDGCAKVVLEVQ